GGVSLLSEERERFAKRFPVKVDEAIPQADIRFGMCEFAVRRPAEIVNRAVLMEQPGDLVRMTDEVRRELRADDEVDTLAVRLAEIDHAPRGNLRQQFLFGIPLE